MAWELGNHSDINAVNINNALKSLEGTISEEEAKVALYKYLYANIGMATELIMGVKLFPFQHVFIKTMMRKDFSLIICSRGAGKSFLTSVFCVLHAIFEQGSKILVLAPSFKQSKLILQQIEVFAGSTKGEMLRQIMPKINQSTDFWEAKIGESRIRALPLGNGDKIRGFRADVIIVDEVLKVPASILEEVIKPFMVVNKDPVERQELYDLETSLIKRGKLKEDERTKFKNPKMVALSSASYKFEHLYNMYQLYLENINDPKKISGASYGVIQIGYKGLPSQYLSETVIEDARKSMSSSQFQREYEAQFSDDSSGYFSMAQMLNCTIQAGGNPTIEVKGDPQAKYILSIDPNYKESVDADHFAMHVMKIDPISRVGYIVHSYAMSGVTLKEHSRYMLYLLKNFNIVYVIIDSGGADQFLRFANESNEFKEANIRLETFEGKFETPEEIRERKAEYNLGTQRIVHLQQFQTQWIRNANQELQAAFQHRKVFFAAPMKDTAYEAVIKDKEIDIKDIQFEIKNAKTLEGEYTTDMEKMIALIDNLNYLLDLTRSECALIEVSSTSLGHQSFDLPLSLRKETGNNRPRKDSYSALLLAYHGLRCYYLIQDSVEEKINTDFEPLLF